MGNYLNLNYLFFFKFILIFYLLTCISVTVFNFLFKNIYSFIMMVFIFLVVFVFSFNFKIGENDNDNKRYAAIVNNKIISFDKYNIVYENEVKKIRNSNNSFSDKDAKNSGLHRKILYNLIIKELLFQYANNFNISVSKKKIIKRIKYYVFNVGAINNSNYRDIIINKFNLTEKNFENNIRKDLVVEKSMLTLLKFVKKFKFFKAKEIFDIQRNKSILSFIKFNLNRIVFNFFYKDIEYWRNKNKCNIVKWINFNSKKYSRNNSFGINHIFLKIKKNYTKKLINPGKKILKLYRIMNYKNNFNFLLNKMSEDFVFLKKQKIKYFKMKNISNQFWNLLIRIDNENKEKWSKVIRSNFGYHIIDNIHTKKGFNLDLKEKFYLLLEDMFKNRKLKYRIKKITINMALFLKGTFIKNDFKIEKILVNYIKKITTRYLYPISNYIKKIKKSKYILFDVFELKSKNMFILKNNCNNNYFIISDVIRKNLKLKNKVKNNTFVKFFIFSNKEVFFNSFIDWLKEKSIIKYNKFFNIT